MRNERGRDGWVEQALTRARYEVLPTAKVEQVIVDNVPRDVGITITASPAKGLEPTLALAERLAGHGFHVVPHLAARMIADRAELERIVTRLVDAGIDDVFCPAGDADPPAGDYVGALTMLEDLTAMGGPFSSVGITGYPESHPAIDDDVAIQAMWDKRRHATYIVSNLCFDPQTIADWIRRVRRRGVDLPVHIGLPGPIERAKLLSVGSRIGVGQSLRFLTGHVGTFARIAAPGGFKPERFLERSARLLGEPELRVEGLHLFTFNQVAETERWRQRLLA